MVRFVISLGIAILLIGLFEGGLINSEQVVNTSEMLLA